MATMATTHPPMATTYRATLFEREEPVATVEQVDEEDRERDDPEPQRERHHAVDLGVEALVEHRPLLVQGAPPVDGEVHDRYVDEGDERGDGTPLGPRLGCRRDAAQ